MKFTNTSTITIQGPRKYQQDRYVELADKLAVIDGMGGPPNGDKAAEEIMITLKKSSVWDKVLFSDINNNIANHKDERGAAMVAAILEGDTLSIEHCGDCRAYIYSPKEHSLIQFTEDQGYGHILYSWMGDPRGYDGKRNKLKVESGQILILTSDGVHDYIPLTALIAVLETGNCNAEDIINIAQKHTQDNATCIVAYISE